MGWLSNYQSKKITVLESKDDDAIEDLEIDVWGLLYSGI